VLRLKDAHLGGIVKLGKLVEKKYKENCVYNDSTRGHTGQDFFITFSIVNYFTNLEGAEIQECKSGYGNEARNHGQAD